MRKYTEYKNLKLADISKEIKQYWEEADIFSKSKPPNQKELALVGGIQSDEISMKSHITYPVLRRRFCCVDLQVFLSPKEGVGNKILHTL